MIKTQRLGVKMNATAQIVTKRRVLEEIEPIPVEVEKVPDDELAFEPLVKMIRILRR